MDPQHAAEMRNALLEFASRNPPVAKADLARINGDTETSAHAVVLPYRPATARRTPVRPALRVDRRRQRQAAAAAR
jgi:hypothetical protein